MKKLVRLLSLVCSVCLLGVGCAAVGSQDISAVPAVPEDTEPSSDSIFTAPAGGTAPGDSSADASPEPGQSNEAVVPPPPAAERSDEDLVRVLDYIPSIYVDLKYAAEDNFTGMVIYDFSDASLRYGTVKKLAEVQEELSAQGYSLKIWDAYRPVSAQFRLWEVCPDPAYVADPNKGHSGHSRGNTLDVTLVTADGTEVEMPSGFDDFSALADRDYSDIPEEAAQNALILENAMTAHGFVGYSAEWWHYADSVSYPVVEE